MQVNENLNVLKAAIENLESAAIPAAVAAIAGTGHKIAWGTGAMTKVGGSNESALATITHGLGATPVFAIATSTHVEATDEPLSFRCQSFTSTTFGVVAFGGTVEYAVTFQWLAIS